MPLNNKSESIIEFESKFITLVDEFVACDFDKKKEERKKKSCEHQKAAAQRKIWRAGMKSGHNMNICTQIWSNERQT